MTTVRLQSLQRILEDTNGVLKAGKVAGGQGLAVRLPCLGQRAERRVPLG